MIKTEGERIELIGNGKELLKELAMTVLAVKKLMVQSAGVPEEKAQQVIAEILSEAIRDQKVDTIAIDVGKILRGGAEK